MSTANFCTQCGATMAQGNNFCAKCGGSNRLLKRRNKLWDTGSDNFPVAIGNMFAGGTLGACFFFFLYIVAMLGQLNGEDVRITPLLGGVLCLLGFPTFGYLAGKMAGRLGCLITIIFVLIIGLLVWKILLL